MSLAYAKTDPNIAPAVGGDIDSGMQRATVNGGMGFTADTPGDPIAGASISGAISSTYHAVVGGGGGGQFGMTPGTDTQVYGFDPFGPFGSVDPTNTVVFEEIWANSSDDESTFIVAADVEGWGADPITVTYYGVGGPFVFTYPNTSPLSWGLIDPVNTPLLIAFFNANLGVPIRFDVVSNAFSMIVGNDGADGYGFENPTFGSMSPSTPSFSDIIGFDNTGSLYGYFYFNLNADTDGWAPNAVQVTFSGGIGAPPGPITVPYAGGPDPFWETIFPNPAGVAVAEYLKANNGLPVIFTVVPI
jgi:hypothetical protein